MKPPKDSSQFRCGEHVKYSAKYISNPWSDGIGRIPNSYPIAIKKSRGSVPRDSCTAFASAKAYLRIR